MANNEAGIQTHRKLVTAAKELFYENGYEKTTLKSICERANIPRSVLFYYFKDKPSIAGYICNKTNNLLFGFVNDEFERHCYTDDLVIKSCVATNLFFSSVTKDKNLNQFYAHAFLNHTIQDASRAFYYSFFKNLYRSRKMNIHSQGFELFFLYNTSSTGIFLYEYYHGRLKSTPEEINQYVLQQILNGLHYNEADIYTIIEETFLISQKIHFNIKDIYYMNS